MQREMEKRKIIAIAKKKKKNMDYELIFSISLIYLVFT